MWVNRQLIAVAFTGAVRLGVWLESGVQSDVFIQSSLYTDFNRTQVKTLGFIWICWRHNLMLSHLSKRKME